MAIISKIQQHAYILVAVIAIALLTFLVEIINPNLSRIAQNSNQIGSVNGKSLDYDFFKSELDKKESEYKASKGQDLNEEEIGQIKNQIWSQFLVDNVINKNLDKLGLAVTPAELKELTTGTNVDPNLKQAPAFLNQNGQFDPMLVVNYIKTLNQDEPNTAPGTKKKQWLAFEKQLKDTRKITKFNTLIENGLYVPKWMADYEVNTFNKTADFNYVVLPYTSINANSIKEDDAEMKKYFEENKNKFTPAVPTTKVSYVSFPLTPSFQDSVELATKFNTRIEEMRASTNDTAFFKAYGDNSYDPNYYKATDLKDYTNIDQILNAPAKSIVGPFIVKDNFKAIKILNKRNISDSVYVKAITISFQDAMSSQEAVAQRMKKVDSIFRQLDTLGQDFDQLATLVSADRGQSPAVWIRKSDKMWNPEIFNLGGSRKYFKSPSDKEGVVRIFKVLNYPATIPAVQLGVISAPYAPSTETQNQIYSKASAFMSKCKTASDIMKIAKTQPGLNANAANLTQESSKLETLEGNAKEIVRWAFNSKYNEVSSMLQVGNNYVFCGNLGLRDKEHAVYEEMKEDIAGAFKNEKITQMLKDKMSKYKSVSEAATANNMQVATAANVDFNTSNFNQVPEPMVVGAALGLKANKLSKPIKGTGGVYLIELTKSTIKPSNPNEDLTLKMQLQQSAKNANGVLEGMIENAKIEDNRANIF